MERLIKSLLCAILLIALADSSSIAAGGDPPPLDISSRVGNDHADILGRRLLAASRNHQKSERPKRNSSDWLTSYELICSRRGFDDGAHPLPCTDSTMYCPDKASLTSASRGYWVMTAPRPSRYGQYQWRATGGVVCTNLEGGPAGAPVLSAAQFRRLPIPAAALKVQPDPASSPTLINIATNLYTTRRAPVLTTSVLGRPVRVRATPSRYRWDYGDGASRATVDAGGPYPDLSTGHVYRRPGRYRVSLSTVYTGEYSVAGGPWQPVAGTATVTSQPATVRALQARNQLVS